MDYLLLRYGEIFLKGGNIKQFERKLRENIKLITGVGEIKQLRCRLILNYFEKHDLLRRVFGLVSYSPVDFVEKDLEKIKEKSLEMVRGLKGTFKVETQRSDKTFPIKSPEMNVLIGRFIEENSNLKFARNNPDNLLGIEINHQGVYLFTETIDCFGGLPSGVEGRVGLLVENQESLLAGLLMMKRGCDLVLVGFKKFKIDLLQSFSPTKLELKLVKNFSGLEEFMVDKKISVLVSGQRFDNYKKLETKLTVLRPLVAYGKKEVQNELEKYNQN